MHPIIPIFSIGLGIIAASILINWLIKTNRIVAHPVLHITTEDCPYDTKVLKEYIDLFVSQYSEYKGIPIDVTRNALQQTHIKFEDQIYPTSRESGDQTLGDRPKNKQTNFTGITIGNEVRLQKARKLYDTALFHELIHVILGGDRYHADSSFSVLPIKLYNLAIRLNLE